MAATLLPTTVRIHGRTFKIRVVDDDLDSGNMGVCDYQQGYITLNSDPMYAKELPDTYLHEAIHAMCYFGQLGLGDNEERVVHVLAGSIVQMFSDNPQLMKWFAEAVTKL